MINTLKDAKVLLENYIKDSNQVFITPHLCADFDAIASAIGISLISNKFSKPNYIFICDDPYKMEPGVKLITEEYADKVNFIDMERYNKLKSNNDLLIATDTNKSYLVGCEKSLNEFKNIIVLDHHMQDEKTIKTDDIYIPKNTSSASEIVVELLCKFGIKYSSDIANYLLSGIYLDTDKLRKGVTARTFQIVSKLLEKGANLDKVQEFFAEDFKNDQKIQDLISKTILTTYTYAIAIEMDDILYTREELAKVADKLLTYKTIDATFAVGSIDENTVSVSARSKGKVDVSKIMSLMNGGGNIYSAAAKIENATTDEVGKTLMKTLKPNFYV